MSTEGKRIVTIILIYMFFNLKDILDVLSVFRNIMFQIKAIGSTKMSLLYIYNYIYIYRYM